MGHENWRWRTGRSVGRTIYAVTKPDRAFPEGRSVLIGMMDTPALAEAAVRAHNAEVEARREREGT